MIGVADYKHGNGRGWLSHYFDEYATAQEIESRYVDFDETPIDVSLLDPDFKAEIYSTVN